MTEFNVKKYLMNQNVPEFHIININKDKTTGLSKI